MPASGRTADIQRAAPTDSNQSEAVLGREGHRLCVDLGNWPSALDRRAAKFAARQTSRYPPVSDAPLRAFSFI